MPGMSRQVRIFNQVSRDVTLLGMLGSQENVALCVCVYVKLLSNEPGPLTTSSL